MSSNLTVFIVDDDPAVRDALGLLLGVRGYRTAVFASGEAFLHAWRADWAGCLLADIRMSGMDGLELQRRLGELGCLIPIIIVTAHGDVSLARAAFKARASDFLEKPFDDAKLIAAIDEALAQEAVVRSDVRRRAAARADAARTRSDAAGGAGPAQPRDRAGAGHFGAHGRSAQGAPDGQARGRQRGRPGAHQHAVTAGEAWAARPLVRLKLAWLTPPAAGPAPPAWSCRRPVAAPAGGCSIPGRAGFRGATGGTLWWRRRRPCASRRR